MPRRRLGASGLCCCNFFLFSVEKKEKEAMNSCSVSWKVQKRNSSLRQCKDQQNKITSYLSDAWAFIKDEDTFVDPAAFGVSSLALDVAASPCRSATSAPASVNPSSLSVLPSSLPLAWHPAEPRSHSVSLAFPPPAEPYSAAPSEAVGVSQSK